jgi:hypothetical protein
MFFFQLSKKKQRPTWQLPFDFADILIAHQVTLHLIIMYTTNWAPSPGCNKNRARFQLEMQCVHVFPFTTTTRHVR